MGSTGYGHKPSNRQKGQRQETAEKYREAVGLYASTRLSCRNVRKRRKNTVKLSGYMPLPGCRAGRYAAGVA